MAESPKISFRMTNPVLAERLRKYAEESGESSLNEVARGLVEGVLQDSYRAELEEHLDQLREQVARARHDTVEEIGKLRRDLSMVLEVVLLNLTPATKEQAEEFVRTKLKG